MYIYIYIYIYRYAGSLGCSLIELLCETPIFPGKDMNNQFELINNYFNMKINDRIVYITSFFKKILINNTNNTNNTNNKEYIHDTKIVITNVIDLLIQILIEPEKRSTSKHILEIINEYQ